MDAIYSCHRAAGGVERGLISGRAIMAIIFLVCPLPITVAIPDSWAPRRTDIYPRYTPAQGRARHAVPLSAGPARKRWAHGIGGQDIDLSAVGQVERRRGHAVACAADPAAAVRTADRAGTGRAASMRRRASGYGAADLQTDFPAKLDTSSRAFCGIVL